MARSVALAQRRLFPNLMLSPLGSALQCIKALMHPRWEDYNYERADPVDNRLHWLGDGQTYNEKTLTGDRTRISIALNAPRHRKEPDVIFRGVVPSRAVPRRAAR